MQLLCKTHFHALNRGVHLLWVLSAIEKYIHPAVIEDFSALSGGLHIHMAVKEQVDYSWKDVMWHVSNFSSLCGMSINSAFPLAFIFI
jgi:hypothetical protein